MPDPSEATVYFRKQWGETEDDSYAFHGTITYDAGGAPGVSSTDVLNMLADTLAADGWELYGSEATQEITRTLITES
jgi:hypothetical protein